MDLLVSFKLDTNRSSCSAQTHESVVLRLDEFARFGAVDLAGKAKVLVHLLRYK